jgi:carbonic anhydrase
MPLSLANYYIYDGSLTTPTCDEIVRWILANQTVPISEYQLIQFQDLRDLNNINVRPFCFQFRYQIFFQNSRSSIKMLTNARPVQPLNSRVVKKSFTDINSSSNRSKSSSSLLAFVAIIFWMF